MATIAERLAELQADRVLVRAQIAAVRCGGQNISMSGLSISKVQYKELQEELTRIDKAIQRIENGGRGIHIDMSASPYGDGGTSNDGSV